MIHRLSSSAKADDPVNRVLSYKTAPAVFTGWPAFAGHDEGEVSSVGVKQGEATGEVMNDAKYSSDVAFTPSVKAVQERKGSRASYGRMEERGGWKTAITPDLSAFIE